MRFVLLLLTLPLVGCLMNVQEAAPRPTPPRPLARKPVNWPIWQSADPLREAPVGNPLVPGTVETKTGQVITYGPRADGREQFVILSNRKDHPTPGIFPLRQCVLPTSIFAGPSPLQIHTNTLAAEDRKWIYPAFDFRSTFFDLYPATTSGAKGLLVYHSSIMLLSIAEKAMIENFRKLGWNVMVALPPDGLYRLKLPTQASPEGSLQSAAEMVAGEMDRHCLEQGHTTRIALEYLSQSRPAWLSGQRVLMGTSAGTFAMPAEALIAPGWDALVLVSGGTNLLSLYEAGSGGLFPDTLRWLDGVRRHPGRPRSRIFSDQEYQQIYRRAAKLTRFQAGALAPLVRDHRILMIAGTLDGIMPEAQALALHQALGAPERWTFPLGHHLIALQLIFEADRIDRWLEKNSATGPSTGSASRN